MFRHARGLREAWPKTKDSSTTWFILFYLTWSKLVNVVMANEEMGTVRCWRCADGRPIGISWRQCPARAIFSYVTSYLIKRTVFSRGTSTSYGGHFCKAQLSIRKYCTAHLFLIVKSIRRDVRLIFLDIL